jgi:hypothetical protein
MLRRFRGMPVVVLVLSLLAGCSTFQQKFYIEVAECRPGWRGPHSTFIRLDLKGYAYFTVSKFEKGWYDKSAVDTLFATVTSEVAKANAAASDMPPISPSKTDPPKSTITTSTSTTTSEPECARGRAHLAGQRVTRVYGPNGREIKDAADKRLVIFVTSNPDAIVNQIATTVNTAEVSQVFAGLLRRGEVTAASDAANALDLAGRRQEAIVIDVDAFSKWLTRAGAPLDPQDARDHIQGLVRQIDTQLQGR